MIGNPYFVDPRDTNNSANHIINASTQARTDRGSASSSSASSVNTFHPDAMLQPKSSAQEDPSVDDGRTALLSSSSAVALYAKGEAELPEGHHAAPPGMQIGPFRLGTRQVVILGSSIIVAFGLLLGLTVPNSKNDDPYPWNRISAVIGWTYFAAWSISFYPQFYLNWARKSVVGYSFDYQTMNIIGFTCYSIYNCAFYWNSTVEQQYKAHYGKPNVVQVNDVFFALHALLFTVLTFLQALFYEHGGQKVHKVSWFIAIVSLVIGVVYAICIAAGANGYIFQWLWYLVSLSWIKLAVTMIKYVPQVHMNYKRKCTVGFNIWNVMLDFTGGSLSVVQQLIDCATTHNWEGISGDPVKFGLGLASMFFDIIFMTQHYFLYHENNCSINEASRRRALQQKRKKTASSV